MCYGDEGVANYWVKNHFRSFMLLSCACIHDISFTRFTNLKIIIIQCKYHLLHYHHFQ